MTSCTILTCEQKNKHVKNVWITCSVFFFYWYTKKMLIFNWRNCTFDWILTCYFTIFLFKSIRLMIQWRGKRCRSEVCKSETIHQPKSGLYKLTLIVDFKPAVAFRMYKYCIKHNTTLYLYNELMKWVYFK